MAGGDKNIPLPPSRSTLPGRKPNPDTISGKIRALDVGESLFFETRQSIVGGIAWKQVESKRAPDGAEYVTRRVGTGCRVWRTK